MSTLSDAGATPAAAIAAAFRRIKGICLDRRQTASVLRGAALVSLIRGGGAALIYTSLVLLARWMAPTQFGIYVYAWSWAMLLAIPAGVGFGTASLRFIPQYQSEEDGPHLAGFVRRAWRVTGIASVVLGGSGALVVLAASNHIAAHYLTPLWIAFASVPALALLALHIDMGRGFGRPGLAYAPRLLAAPVLLVAGTAILILAGFDPSGALVLGVALATCLMIAAVQGRAIGRNLASVTRRAPPAYEKSLWWRVALPLVLASGFHVVLSQTDIIMIGMYLTPDDVAIYYAAVKTGVFISFPMTAVNAVAAPRIAALHAQGKLGDLQALVSSMSHWIFWSALVASAVAILFGVRILALFGPAFAAAYGALVILVCGQLARAASGLVGDLLAVTGHQNQNALVMGCSAILNVVLNALLIPRFGIVGAAAATAVTMVVWNVWLWRLARRRIGVDPSIVGALRRSHHVVPSGT